MVAAVVEHKPGSSPRREHGRAWAIGPISLLPVLALFAVSRRLRAQGG